MDGGKQPGNKKKGPKLSDYSKWFTKYQAGSLELPGYYISRIPSYSGIRLFISGSVTNFASFGVLNQVLKNENRTAKISKISKQNPFQVSTVGSTNLTRRTTKR